MKLDLPDFGKLLEEARNRKEEWSWDGIVPARDVTLIAAYMKKGKTTLLSGYVNAVLRTGFYCGLGTARAQRVLYLAPEEGDTLLRRFHRLGFDPVDQAGLCVIPRGASVWEQLVEQYRTRNWPGVVAAFKGAGFDHVVLDGLHTMLQMFEPNAKEDNEGVGRFMAHFVLPFGSDFTVVASLHTKKAGGDPRSRPAPDEMIRGASAWMAHPGQVLVMQTDPKEDLKSFACFGRYETSRAHGFTFRYDGARRDYVGLIDDAPEEVTMGMAREAEMRARVLNALHKDGNNWKTVSDIQASVSLRKAVIPLHLADLVQMGMAERQERKRLNGRTAPHYRAVTSLDSTGKVDPDPDSG